MFNEISYKLQIKSLRERKSFLSSLLSDFSKNLTQLHPLDDILNYLNQKSKKRLVEENKQNIKERNIQLGLGPATQCSCENFIQICVDEEDNLCYLIQLTESQINALHLQLEDNKKLREEESFNYNDSIGEDSYLVVHILDAKNFFAGPGNNNSMVYVDVQLEGGKSFKTKEMPVENSTVYWNEPLQIPVTLNDLSTITSVRLVVSDYEHDNQQSFIGSCSIRLKKNTENQLEFKEKLFSKMGHELGSLLHFRVKLVVSQEKLLNDVSKRIESEMKVLHEKLEKYEYLLKNLREYFELPMAKKKDPPKQLGPNYHILWAPSCEEKLEARLDRIFRKLGINSVALLFYSSILLAILGTLVCFLRASFFDVEFKFFKAKFIRKLVISFGAFSFVFPDHKTFNHFYMRCWLLVMVFSVVVDITWFVLFTENWFDYYDSPLNDWKMMIVIFAYITFLFKILYWIVFWKCSVRSQNPDFNFERDFRAKFEEIHEKTRDESFEEKGFN